ncbi:MAG TPA: hypothetical protein IAB12_06050 [Candidatus Ornithospirochaeta avicola]|uniref:Uncharacterized protein n=1 Tax=Candidatus Ornithospirochaeta avicola TaxID=2840896 RepID=A0A9D1PTJ5_9SPIO|nr:hypothetical protein [Candidatus Ornithospirochaeta avicola]
MKNRSLVFLIIAIIFIVAGAALFAVSAINIAPESYSYKIGGFIYSYRSIRIVSSPTVGVKLISSAVMMIFGVIFLSTSFILSSLESSVFKKEKDGKAEENVQIPKKKEQEEDKKEEDAESETKSQE